MHIQVYIILYKYLKPHTLTLMLYRDIQDVQFWVFKYRHVTYIMYGLTAINLAVHPNQSVLLTIHKGTYRYMYDSQGNELLP